MKPLSECRLYTFVDTAYLRGRSPQSVSQSLCEGGSDLIQLRAKDSPLDEIRDMAAAILPITTRAGVYLVINDHPPLAAETGAPFCHLGQEDFFDVGYNHTSQLRTRDPQLRVGLSTHTPSQAERAIAAGADYIAVGPVYATGTKPTAKPVTLDYVKWATANVKIPWFAIGGINLENLDAVLAVGARRIGVVSAILNAANIPEACRNFKSRLLSTRIY
jgi:thiamine-phosphate pyrophosphorylase